MYCLTKHLLTCKGHYTVHYALHTNHSVLSELKHWASPCQRVLLKNPKRRKAVIAVILRQANFPSRSLAGHTNHMAVPFAQRYGFQKAKDMKKSRNGDTLGPVELIVWPEQGNQGDWREQDGQDEVYIIIFGMSKSSGFQKYSICWVFRHFVCVFVFVVVFVIVFVFVFVSSYDFWIAFIISFQNMYGYRGLWSLRAEIMVIFEVMTDTQTHRHTDSKSTYRLGPSGRMGRVKIDQNGPN